ncbi:hypothetical protein [Cellulosimicrobium sp. Marseille-Q4280]|uniref:hypothetical protein n=1 Tax=Cellulosimicrobium sp. Marseille-Q4280 TaxID=2937992 RepID=UPI0020420E90|nr:hypothetical protein [Cellulosimicrobium sp. Marseille-Q4280]
MSQRKTTTRRLVAITLTTTITVGAAATGAIALDRHNIAQVALQAEATSIRAEAYNGWLGREIARRDAIEITEARKAATAGAAAAQAVLDASPNADETLRTALATAITAATQAATQDGEDLDVVAIRAAGTAATDAAPAVTESQAAWQAAEDARIEAERIAAEKAAAEAAARKAAQRANQSERTAAVVEQVAPSGVAWSTRIVNSGGQGAVDACAGGVTRWSSNIEGKAYLPIHEHCGGSPILSLGMGQMVAISGGGLDGVYQVVDSRNVAKGDSVTAAYGIGGSVLLQTCYVNSNLMRIVGVVKVG